VTPEKLERMRFLAWGYERDGGPLGEMARMLSECVKEIESHAVEVQHLTDLNALQWDEECTKGERCNKVVVEQAKRILELESGLTAARMCRAAPGEF